jgi:uncharacterized protein involved in cysteine biosynthesis
MQNPLNRLDDHPSYRIHLKQFWTQIMLPILIAVLGFIVVIVLISLATFHAHGNVNRWAAISTIWLVLPVLVAGLILLVLLIGMIYLLAQITSIIPSYSYQAQQITYRVETSVKSMAQMFRKPVMGLQELAKLVRVYIENIRKANSS